MMPPIDDGLPSLDEFHATKMTFRGKEKTVYFYGNAVPGIVLMHEIPGLSRHVLRFAKVLGQNGFRVALPSLFGRDGVVFSKLDEAVGAARMCVSAEFSVFSANGSSPVVDWLRDLCICFAKHTGGNIGAIGLCITGGFALSLTVGTEGKVQAPVMSEPALPFIVPLTKNAAALHLTPAERASIAAGGPDVMGLRFTNDSICPQARFDAYEDLLTKPRFKRIEIPSPDPARQIGSCAHSVLTNDLVNVAGNPTLDALGDVIAFLKARLPA